MLLTPLYDTPSFFQIDLPLGDPGAPLLRQRQRLTALLEGRDAGQWAAASRCEAWSVQDVVSHLVTTNQFWTFSIGAAQRGEPTRFLTTFDPVTSPAELVAAARAQSAAEVLDRFIETSEALAKVIAEVDGDGWSTLGEAPPGHVPLRAVALHALWDSWVHERDIALPLGLDPVEEADEVVACLCYAAALGPAMAVTNGSSRRGAIAVDATDPCASFVVEVGEGVLLRGGDAPDDALHLGGPAVDLVEALSLRVPLTFPVPEARRWLLSGLAVAFDRTS